MITDTHVHIYPPELVRDQELISRTEPHFDLLTHNAVHKWGTAEDLIAAMDRTGVAQSWAFGFAFRDPGLCRLCNDYVIDAVRRYPDRLKGFAVVNPARRGFVAEMERCAAAGLTGVGELFPQGQGFPLDDARWTEYRTAAERFSPGSLRWRIYAELLRNPEDYPEAANYVSDESESGESRADEDKRSSSSESVFAVVGDLSEQREKEQSKHVVHGHDTARNGLVHVEGVCQDQRYYIVVHLPERADGHECQTY